MCALIVSSSGKEGYVMLLDGGLGKYTFLNVFLTGGTAKCRRNLVSLGSLVKVKHMQIWVHYESYSSDFCQGPAFEGVQFSLKNDLTTLFTICYSFQCHSISQFAVTTLPRELS